MDSNATEQRPTSRDQLNKSGLTRNIVAVRKHMKESIHGLVLCSHVFYHLMYALL